MPAFITVLAVTGSLISVCAERFVCGGGSGGPGRTATQSVFVSHFICECLAHSHMS